MTSREAACSCGQLSLTVKGDPVRVSMCHCLECQRRTGSTFGVQAWYSREQVQPASGVAKQYARRAESGRLVTFNFCPNCGGLSSGEPSNAPIWLVWLLECLPIPHSIGPLIQFGREANILGQSRSASWSLNI
ncbi:MAG: GFA family protein [Beijerinckiaceae bacterium]